MVEAQKCGRSKGLIYIKSLLSNWHIYQVQIYGGSSESSDAKTIIFTTNTLTASQMTGNEQQDQKHFQ